MAKSLVYDSISKHLGEVKVADLRSRSRVHDVPIIMRSLLFISFAISYSASDPAEDIAAIRTMLGTIFQRYSSEMADLRQVVESAERKIESFERDLNRRLSKVEDYLSRSQRGVSVSGSSASEQRSEIINSHVEERLEKLEELTKAKSK